MTFIQVWVGYAIFGTALFSAALIWAVRQRQFTDMDKARHFALRDVREEDAASGKPTRADWSGLVIILAVAVAAIFAAICVAWKSR